MKLLERETPESILPLPWPPNSPDLNPVDCGGHTVIKVVQNIHDWSRGTMHHRRTEWAKLDHAIIASAVHHCRRHLSLCVMASWNILLSHSISVKVIRNDTVE